MKTIKRMKKILAIMMCMVMLLGFTVIASAETTPRLIITGFTTVSTMEDICLVVSSDIILALYRKYPTNSSINITTAWNAMISAESISFVLSRYGIF